MESAGLLGRGPNLYSTPAVFVVDDDISVRDSLRSLIRFAGWHDYQGQRYTPLDQISAKNAANLVPSCGYTFPAKEPAQTAPRKEIALGCNKAPCRSATAVKTRGR